MYRVHARTAVKGLTATILCSPGRLFVSKEDGRSPTTGKIEHVFTFGGRGFGIRDANNFETPTVIVDGVERVTERYYSNIFNTAYMANTDTPQTDKEATSPSLVKQDVFTCLLCTVTNDCFPVGQQRGDVERKKRERKAERNRERKRREERY